MDDAQGMGFRRAWELTAPESYALLHGAESRAKIEALKLAVGELVARKELSLERVETPGLFGLRKGVSDLLVAGGQSQRYLGARSLQAALDLVRAADDRALQNGTPRGITVERFVRAVRKKYGWPAGYADAEVMPTLAERGLYRREDRKLKLPFGASLPLGAPNWRLTVAGEQKREELWRGVILGEERFGGWVDKDPVRAAEFLAVAGSAVLLIGKIHSDLRRLNERRAGAGEPEVHAAGPGATSPNSWTLGSDTEAL